MSQGPSDSGHRRSWRPTASRKMLQKRADVLNQIRHFFYQRQVMEVQTPTLMPNTVTDPHIDSLAVQVFPHKNPYYLQTSPEYAMKRLLASGSGDIYQMGPVYRHEQLGRLHQIEFTLLEWYRVGWHEQQLIDEVVELVLILDPYLKVERHHYQSLFFEYFEVNCHDVDRPTLEVLCQTHVPSLKPQGLSHSDLIEALFGFVIQPQLGQNGLAVVDHYPKAQAALAQVKRHHGEEVAERFEVFMDGIEIANGYHELQDPTEQKKRMLSHNQARQALGRTPRKLDAELIAALEHGLPSCAGVALGIDRLLMVLMGCGSLDEVMPFPLR